MPTCALAFMLCQTAVSACFTDPGLLTRGHLQATVCRI